MILILKFMIKDKLEVALKGFIYLKLEEHLMAWQSLQVAVCILLASLLISCEKIKNKNNFFPKSFPGFVGLKNYFSQDLITISENCPFILFLVAMSNGGVLLSSIYVYRTSSFLPWKCFKDRNSFFNGKLSVANKHFLKEMIPLIFLPGK